MSTPSLGDGGKISGPGAGACACEPVVSRWSRGDFVVEWSQSGRADCAPWAGGNKKAAPVRVRLKGKERALLDRQGRGGRGQGDRGGRHFLAGDLDHALDLDF